MSKPDYSLDEIVEQMGLLKALSPSPAKAEVYGSVISREFRVTFQPYGYQSVSDDRKKFTCAGSAKTWRAAFAACAADFDAKLGDNLRETAKRMAVAIMTATVENGACTHATLRGAGFTQIEIDTVGERAVATANEYADAGPFALIPASSNGDPIEEPEAA